MDLVNWTSLQKLAKGTMNMQNKNVKKNHGFYRESGERFWIQVKSLLKQKPVLLPKKWGSQSNGRGYELAEKSQDCF